jgi:hypothetical protein
MQTFLHVRQGQLQDKSQAEQHDDEYFPGKLLTAEAQARLLTYRNDFLIKDIKCAPLKYKVIMHLAMLTPLPPPSCYAKTCWHWEHM